MQRQKETGRGFTLIETAAGIVAIGTLVAVLAPVGSVLQQQNLDTQSQHVHQELARRQMMYIADNDGAFTGPNTSGLNWARQFIGGPGDPSQYSLEFNTAPGNPTSVGDWITPLVGEARGFSTNRAMRMAQMFEALADPTTTERVDTLFVNQNAPPTDAHQFAAIQKSKGFRQRSFLQMRSFTHFSSEHRFNEIIVEPDGSIVLQRYAVQVPGANGLSPKGYTPRIWNVGTQLSNKVMFADGTRFYDDQNGLVLSIEIQQSIFPDDSSSGPIFHRSIAYGRDSLSSPSQRNLDLSYRKQGGDGLYATMFDGSLRYFTREESWTDPTPWYPSGSLWQAEDATPESQAWVTQNLPNGIIP